MKLYLITLKGFVGYGNPSYKNNYVVTEDVGSAVEKVQEFLEEKKIGIPQDRELDTVQLLAETGNYPNCKTILFI